MGKGKKEKRSLLLSPQPFFIIGIIDLLLFIWIDITYSHNSMGGGLLNGRLPILLFPEVFSFGAFILIVYSISLKLIKLEKLSKVFRYILKSVSVFLIVCFIYLLIYLFAFIFGFVHGELSTGGPLMPTDLHNSNIIHGLKDSKIGSSYKELY